MQTEVDKAASKVVRLLALSRDVTVEEVAAACSIGRDTMFRRLRGASEWKASELKRLAVYFGVPVQVLYDGPDALLVGATGPAREAGDSAYHAATGRKVNGRPIVPAPRIAPDLVAA